MQLPKLVKIALFEESRKVSFGVYLFATSTVLLYSRLITPDNWMFCMMFSSVLVGGGTIADSMMKIKGGKGSDENPAPTKTA